ncbi:MAG: nitrate/sulfonate/bicarbonate ABC transporter ATP-binding protein [Gammaproteobacteria bacterium]|nr:nitrate/sulfonate/bicarbonate ABC transporter ATP-binding protein [Gammaproteobacteria bacterium]
MSNAIIQVNDVIKTFHTPDGQELLVLEDVNFTLKDGEIVALLGKSGSGKSTLMRIIAGLIPPTTGTVSYRGKAVLGPIQDISMVFQSFALLPWLTVLQNVELGLEALKVPREERRQRALKAIDMIGLDGFESAYPKELSGGMKQRVGFARALVVDPDVLVMDEPFSALDVLTAENLRGDLLDLWGEKKINTKAMIIVTHNIEEAVAIADRILIFGSNPGGIRSELMVKLPQPRDEEDAAFRKLVDEVYKHMTNSDQSGRKAARKGITLSYRIPDANISEITGLLESIGEYEGSVDLPELAEDSQLDVDDLFPLTEALEILQFAKVSSGDIVLTDAGKRFYNADILERKNIFAQHLLDYVPLAKRICKTLDEKRNHKASEERFLTLLEAHFTEREAERVLKTVIDWGRYAELFAYDYNAGILSLENPE